MYKNIIVSVIYIFVHVFLAQKICIEFELSLKKLIGTPVQYKIY